MQLCAFLTWLVMVSNYLNLILNFFFYIFSSFLVWSTMNLSGLLNNLLIIYQNIITHHYLLWNSHFDAFNCVVLDRNHASPSDSRRIRAGQKIVYVLRY